MSEEERRERHRQNYMHVQVGVRVAGAQGNIMQTGQRDA